MLTADFEQNSYDSNFNIEIVPRCTATVHIASVYPVQSRKPSLTSSSFLRVERLLHVSHSSYAEEGRGVISARTSTSTSTVLSEEASDDVSSDLTGE